MLDEPFPKMPGGLDELNIVHRNKRLQRRVGPFAPGAETLARRRVKCYQGRRWGGPFPKGVQTATVERFPMVLRELGSVAGSVTNRFPNTFGLVRPHPPATHFFD